MQPRLKCDTQGGQTFSGFSVGCCIERRLSVTNLSSENNFADVSTEYFSCHQRLWVCCPRGVRFLSSILTSEVNAEEYGYLCYYLVFHLCISLSCSTWWMAPHIIHCTGDHQRTRKLPTPWPHTNIANLFLQSKWGPGH